MCRENAMAGLIDYFAFSVLLFSLEITIPVVLSVLILQIVYWSQWCLYNHLFRLSCVICSVFILFRLMKGLNPGETTLSESTTNQNFSFCSVDHSGNRMLHGKKGLIPESHSYLNCWASMFWCSYCF